MNKTSLLSVTLYRPKKYIFFLLTTLSKKSVHCMLVSCMLEPRQFRVVKGRQSVRYTDHSHFTYAAAQVAYFIANIWLFDCHLWGHKLCHFSSRVPRLTLRFRKLRRAWGRGYISTCPLQILFNINTSTPTNPCTSCCIHSSRGISMFPLAKCLACACFIFSSTKLWPRTCVLEHVIGQKFWDSGSEIGCTWCCNIIKVT